MADTFSERMIDLNNVSKTYPLRTGRKVILKGATISLPWRNTAILGRNGAGKSTLLRLISGIEKPDTGTTSRHKTISWPIGFRGSFHHELSGIENVRFVARIYRQNTEEVIDKVESFAELGQFFYEPFKTYSSGMGARLAFGLSMAINFEVFLIDEVMAVGDERFQRKSKRAFSDRLPTARVIMVSHSMPALREHCQSGLIVDDGNLIYYEELEGAIEHYRALNA
ncbi:ABC transporter ATP-binding protein [uncultured Sulfitobacter sp.]|jgi:capsular polysaccharide transport system ATP-binding protein|uniref:ABC transporter ATP-binding protein n=1 Tax=Sulfitobacter sp. SH22 TaxID=3421172 RepID=UPI0025FBC716|nr:ABC transporter ATP-binding protein [uncultured Sulfitobacter sp.]